MKSFQDFLFVAEHGAASLRLVRVGLSLIAAWYFISHWADVGVWFAEDGVLSNAQVIGFLETANLTSETNWQWSPLFLVNSIVFLRAFLAFGVVLAIATIVGPAKRVPAVLLWLWVVWLANRSLLIAGPEELVLTYGLGYLALASPADMQPRMATSEASTTVHCDSWLTNLARRLIQLHTTLLIGMTALTMLASKVWWDGTGSVAVAAPLGRRSLDVSEAISNPWIHEPLTHLIVLVAMFGCVTIWMKNLRQFSLYGLLVWCLVMAILSSQWMYLASIAVLLQAFQTERKSIYDVQPL